MCPFGILSHFITICQLLKQFVRFCRSLSHVITSCQILLHFVICCHFLSLFVTVCHILYKVTKASKVTKITKVYKWSKVTNVIQWYVLFAYKLIYNVVVLCVCLLFDIQCCCLLMRSFCFAIWWQILVCPFGILSHFTTVCNFLKQFVRFYQSLSHVITFCHILLDVVIFVTLCQTAKKNIVSHLTQMAHQKAHQIMIYV